jgi:hypothetical protein
VRDFECTPRPAAVADHFKVDIRKLVKDEDNQKLFKINRNMTYKYQTTLKLDEMQQTLRTVQSVTREMVGTVAIEPYFVCTHYDANGQDTPVKCDQETLDDDMEKAKQNLTQSLCTRNGTVSVSQLCN